MRLNKGLTPYPVLSSMDDDYVRGSFRAEVQEEISFGQLKLSIDYMLDEPGLQELFAQGKVSYATHVECSLVGYRQLFSSKNNHENVTIDAGKSRSAPTLSQQRIYTDITMNSSISDSAKALHSISGGAVSLPSDQSIRLISIAMARTTTRWPISSPWLSMKAIPVTSGLTPRAIACAFM